MLLPYLNVDRIEASIDEVGRGSLAARVYVAAVVWDSSITTGLVDSINDSKKLTPKKRAILSDYIKEHALDYSICFREAHEIDSSNILRCTMECMHSCLDRISTNYDSIVVDGNTFVPYRDKLHTCVISGDSKYIGVAAASILAKHAHDEHMREIANEYPIYGWEKNNGYGSKHHIDAILTYGATKYHRLSYEPVKSLLHTGKISVVT